MECLSSAGKNKEQRGQGLGRHLNAEITVIMKLDLGNDCKLGAKLVSEQAGHKRERKQLRLKTKDRFFLEQPPGTYLCARQF